MKKLLTALAALAATAFAAPAVAEPISLSADDVGSSFQIDYDGFSGDSSNTISDLTATLILTLDSISGDTYNFSYQMLNTTGGDLSSNISSFAFNVDPDIAGASVDGAYSYTFVTDGRANDPSYPNQVGAVDVCFKAANSGSCSNGGGVAEGDSGSGTLSLFFDPTAPGEITLDNFFVRYQGITGAGGVGSATGGQTSTSGLTPPGGTTTTTTSTSGTPVPAPGMLALLALALASLGFFRRRREVAQPQPAFA
ncbi:cistern family PEP-CTERM protein [Aurantiacibacter sp. D1-12]|uniref:cistern family PEP-CTERM protein n=1 Tax=Aurantiacibacter sp. D1-12 TaxID=2993658 RepID=UPI00237CF383|nr:cistern family PEP-CTERM protein [Aurantiacibacter sp. D1-12]MDE1466679.1 cistern family PEP-CTERM protein [Aurantiacibacter sp. D1-12]